MAGAAVDAESTTARLGLLAASKCVRQHKGEHVHKKKLVYTSCARSVFPGSGSRRGAAT
jgi:hypothetical protein